MFPELETSRLLLREITHKDIESFYECFSNDQVTRYYWQESLKNKDQAKNFIDIFKKMHQEKKGIRWGLHIKGNEKLVGTIGFNAWLRKHKRAE